MRSNGSTQTIPSPERAIATLADDLSAVKGDLATLMRSGRRHIVDRASEGAHHVADAARERAVKAKDSLTDFVTERPFTTIALSAIGGALLVGMLRHYWRR